MRFFNLSRPTQVTINLARSSDIMSSSLGDEDALNRMAVQPETLSRVDERGWIPLHEAAVQENRKILEIIFSGSEVIKRLYDCNA